MPNKLQKLFEFKTGIFVSDEKKKTKFIDNEVNPVWNEVINHLTLINQVGSAT